jgi:hypothetical protein
MTNEQKDAVAGVLISQKFNKGANIVNEGDQADSFYIIKDVNSRLFSDNVRVKSKLPREARKSELWLKEIPSVNKPSTIKPPEALL